MQIRSEDGRLMPGPKPIFPTGIVIDNERWPKHRVQDRISMYQAEYGPIFQFHTAWFSNVVVSSVEGLSDIVSGQWELKPSPLAYLGSHKGIVFNPDVPQWKILRKCAVTAIMRKAVMTRLLTSIQERMLRKITAWKQSVAADPQHKQTIELLIDEEISRVFLESLLQTLFSFSEEDLQAHATVISKSTQAVLASMSWMHRLPRWILRFIKDSTFDEGSLGMQRIIRIFGDCMAARKLVSLEQRPGDVLDAFIELQEQQIGSDVPLADGDVVQSLLDLVAAGHETSSHTAAWALQLLGENPEEQEETRKELLPYFSKADTLSLADVGALKYSDGVVREALRIFPIVPMIAKMSSVEERVQGWVIPPETPTLINLWSIHRDPNYWPEPMKFAPKRWLQGDAGDDVMTTGNLITLKSRNQSRVLPWHPFGAGARVCIGVRMGHAQVVAAVSLMLHHFDISTIHPGEPHTQLTIRPKGLIVALKPRY